MLTDTEILNWLLSNVNYMEHGPDKYAFWPHEDFDPSLLFEEDKLGLTLREYVVARIKESLQ